MRSFLMPSADPKAVPPGLGVRIRAVGGCGEISENPFNLGFFRCFGVWFFFLFSPKFLVKMLQKSLEITLGPPGSVA